MSPSRKTLTQHAAEIEQWIAQGWLTGQETFIELQDMAIDAQPTQRSPPPSMRTCTRAWKKERGERSQAEQC